MIIIIVLEVYHTKKKNLKKLHLFIAYLKKIKKNKTTRFELESEFI